jgi:hypothetical protein
MSIHSSNEMEEYISAITQLSFMLEVLISNIDIGKNMTEMSSIFWDTTNAVVTTSTTYFNI